MNTISFRYDVPLEQTMAFEAVYPEAEQLPLSKKKQIREVPGSIFVWMFLDGELAGEIYGIPLTTISGLTDLTDSEKKTGIHCYSNTIFPRFQNRGLGKTLKAHWLGVAKDQGFDTVYGYARPGASQALNARFGAVFIASFPDWCGTGQEYKLYRLVLPNVTGTHYGRSGG